MQIYNLNRFQATDQFKLDDIFIDRPNAAELVIFKFSGFWPFK